MINEIGNIYGRLKVINLSDKVSGKRKRIMWLCLCSCGNYVSVAGEHLRSKNTISCGCYRTEELHKRKTHGMTDTKTYRAWEDMKKRCYQIKNKRYSSYGARGIVVCDRWKHSFENFLADMGLAPPGMSLERSNNNGNYEPGNCKWIPRSDQGKNTSRIIWVEFNGQVKSVAEWARENNMKDKTLRKRLKKMDISKALTTPLRVYFNNISR